MNRYETVFIVTPVLSDSQVKETVKKFADLITSQEGTIEHQEVWGLRRFAYSINKVKTGFYHLMEFSAPPDLPKRLNVEFSRDDRIVRYLVCKQDKFAEAYSEKRKQKRQQEKKQQEEES